MIMLYNLLLIFLIHFISSSCCTEIIKTKYGSIRGISYKFLEKNVDAYLGIPYAEPPVGKLRFKPPKELTKRWKGVLNATQFEFACIQSESWMNRAPTSEDCLYLNIWVPKTDSKIPKAVMLFVHGGSFTFGTASYDEYDGRAIASVGDVIVVTINYRLGAFGFLYGYGIEGNYALKDQSLAIKWVHENIHLFGGDASLITLFGESAGSICTGLHLISSSSRGYIKRAILESGTPYHWIGGEEKTIASTKAVQLASSFGCLHYFWVECLQQVSAKSIMEWTKTWLMNGHGFAINTPFVPIFGDDFMPRRPVKELKDGRFMKDADIMLGVNNQEGAYFLNKMFPKDFNHENPKNLSKSDAISYIKKLMNVSVISDSVAYQYTKNIANSDSEALRESVVSSISDFLFDCPTEFMAERLSTKNNVYAYYLSYRSHKKPLTSHCNGWMKSCHAEDLPFVFGLPLRYPDKYDKTDYDFSFKIIKTWTEFAKTGKPSPNWPTFASFESNKLSSRYLELNPNGKNNVITNPFSENCWNFWKKLIDASSFFG